MLTMNRLMYHHHIFTQEDGETIKHAFREQLTFRLTSALRRSAAIHTVLGGSVSSLPMDNSDLRASKNLLGSVGSDARHSTSRVQRKTFRQKLIENPFPKVKHTQKWCGSPSSNKGLTYSSSSNHFIINIQEIPRKVPPIPESSIILRISPKSTRQLRPITANRRRPKTAPTTEGNSNNTSTWEMTTQQVEEGNASSSAYYADDFEAPSPKRNDEDKTS